jgi:hypothetical protein
MPTFAGEPGNDPSPRLSESRVLPVHHSPMLLLALIHGFDPRLEDSKSSVLAITLEENSGHLLASASINPTHLVKWGSRQRASFGNRTRITILPRSRNSHYTKEAL